MEKDIYQTVSQMDASLQDLSNTFKSLQENQEKKINQYQAALYRPKTDKSNGPDDMNNKDYTDFLRKGMGQKSLSSNDRGGGFLIPPFIVRKIQTQLGGLGSLRHLSNTVDITTDQYEVLIEKGNADVGWASEIQDRTDTDLPELLKIQIPTHEIYAKPKVSQKILDDSAINLNEWMSYKICDAMSIMENTAFIKGDGIGKPKGILSYVHGDIETINSGIIGGLQDADILLKTVNSLKSEMLYGASWVMSRSALALIRLLKDPSTGRHLLQPSLQEGMATTIFGFPVFVNDALDTVQSGVKSSPILFGNFKLGYQIVDRKDMTLLRDPYSAKPFVEFYATKRVGGDVINKDAIKIIHLSD